MIPVMPFEIFQKSSPSVMAVMRSLFVRSAGFRRNLAQVCFVAGTSLAVTEDTVAFRSLEVQFFSFGDRFGV